MTRDAAGFFIVLVLAAELACDPGIAVRQAPQSGAASGSAVLLSVRTTHSFVGATWYSTAVTITNRSRAPIAITAVDLIARGLNYHGEASASEPFPVNVSGGATQAIGVQFELQEDVRTAFKKPAELQVHYTVNGKTNTATAQLLAASY